MQATEKNLSIKTWLFNPFHYVAGAKSLVIGMIIIAASSLVGSISHSHFDGVLDFHTGLSMPLWFFIAEGFISWIVMAVIVCLAGLVLSKTRFRIIDIFGTQALARTPHLITSLAALVPGYEHFSNLIVAQPLEFLEIGRKVPAEFAVFIFVMIATIMMTVWMIYLMYRSFSVSSNVSGTKAIIIFIVAVIAAEILSKICIANMAAMVLK